MKVNKLMDVYYLREYGLKHGYFKTEADMEMYATHISHFPVVGCDDPATIPPAFFSK